MNILTKTENGDLLPMLSEENEDKIIPVLVDETKKRKLLEGKETDAKKQKCEILKNIEVNKNEAEDEDIASASTSHAKTATPNVTKPHQSPKKRLDIASPHSRQREKFIYGNYNKYYGYRNEHFHDIRLDVFEKVRHLFLNKDILDIGCNSGMITIEIAKKFAVKHVTGIDIDKTLINRVNKSLRKSKKSATAVKTNGNNLIFPFNITFVHGNYILRHDALLEIEREQFDLILCLSVTKWMHLNFGDTGLKQSFKRMFRQLRPGGILILEPQTWDGYQRRKKLTPEIFSNYQSIRFKPQDFTSYLLSEEVGFKDVSLLDVPEHNAQGFRRPIQMFTKKA